MIYGRTNISGGGGGGGLQILFGNGETTPVKEGHLLIDAPKGPLLADFKPNRPVAVAEGTLFIGLSYFPIVDDVSFALTKGKDVVTLHPTTVERFVSGGWEKAEAYIVKNGAWQSIYPAEFLFVRDNLNVVKYTLDGREVGRVKLPSIYNKHPAAYDPNTGILYVASFLDKKLTVYSYDADTLSLLGSFTVSTDYIYGSAYCRNMCISKDGAKLWMNWTHSYTLGTDSRYIVNYVVEVPIPTASGATISGANIYKNQYSISGTMNRTLSPVIIRPDRYGSVFIVGRVLSTTDTWHVYRNSVVLFQVASTGWSSAYFPFALLSDSDIMYYSKNKTSKQVAESVPYANESTIAATPFSPNNAYAETYGSLSVAGTRYLVMINNSNTASKELRFYPLPHSEDNWEYTKIVPFSDSAVFTNISKTTDGRVIVSTDSRTLILGYDYSFTTEIQGSFLCSNIGDPNAWPERYPDVAGAIL